MKLPAPCCAEALASRIVRARLLDLLCAKEKQLDEARREIAHLEQQIARARPSLLSQW